MGCLDFLHCGAAQGGDGWIRCRLRVPYKHRVGCFVFWETRRTAVQNNGRENTSIFLASSFGPENQRSKLHTPQGNHGEPSTSLIHQ